MVEVNNLTSFKIDKSSFQEIGRSILKKEGRENKRLSIALVSPEEIRKLNRKYRDKDSVTDVLSFFYKNDIIKNKKEPKSLLGEVILCPQRIKENAEEFNQNFKKELHWALIHGILHLLGYDHQKEKETKKMKEKEKHYLEFLNK